MNTRGNAARAVAVAVCVLLAAACASDPDSAGEPSAGSASTTTATTTAPTVPPPRLAPPPFFQRRRHRRRAGGADGNVVEAELPRPAGGPAAGHRHPLGLRARRAHRRLVVHADAAKAIVEVFQALYEARFPVQQVRLVDDFGGDDSRSMAANNTSAFNCRPATGSTRWSEHAYGRAIDINPIQNPYVTASGAVLPPEGAAYVGPRSCGAGPDHRRRSGGRRLRCRGLALGWAVAIGPGLPALLGHRALISASQRYDCVSYIVEQWMEETNPERLRVELARAHGHIEALQRQLAELDAADEHDAPNSRPPGRRPPRPSCPQGSPRAGRGVATPGRGPASA